MADHRGLLATIDDVTQREYVTGLLLKDLWPIYDDAGIFMEVPDRDLLMNAHITRFFALAKGAPSDEDGLPQFSNRRFGGTDFMSILREVDRVLKSWGVEDYSLSVNITKHWTENLIL